MKIASLTLSNFRCFSAARLELRERVTFVIGPNHAGKSSVIDALRLALVGRCRGTDARGAGAEGLIRDGSTPGIAKMEIAAVGPTGAPLKIVRTQNGRTASRVEVDLGVSSAVVDACLHTEAFLGLHHGDAKNLLLEAVDARVPVGDERLTLAEVDARYQQWFTERAARKKALAAIVVGPKPSDEAMPDLDALEAQLAAVRDDEKALISELSEDAGRRTELGRSVRHAEEKIRTLEAQRSTLAAAKDLAGATGDLADALLEVEERLATTALTEVEEEAGEKARITLVDAEGRLKLLADTVEGITHHAPDRGCVLNAEIECRTPAKAFQVEIKHLKDQIAAVRTEQQEATTAVEAARLRQRDRMVLETRRGALQQQTTALATLDADLTTLRAALVTMTVERDACAMGADDTTALTAVRERITRGEAIIRAARGDVQTADNYRKATTQQQAAARALGEAERQVDLYGPKGARVAALTAALEHFQARINDGLAPFGYTLRIVADPWLVLVNGRSAELLSTSERLEVGIALQLALAAVTGFGFVAIDAADTLVGLDRRRLGQVIDQADPAVQVLVAMSQDDSFDPPTIEGWAWHRVVPDADRGSAIVPVGVGEAVAV